MNGLSVGDEVSAKAEKSSNGYVAVVWDSELLIRNDNNISAGDSVTVRVVGPNSVVVPSGYSCNKEGLPGELFAIVDHCPDHYPSKVRCIEPPFVGEQFLIEELESESNEIVPILPLDTKAVQRAAICTKPSLWPGERVGERREYSYSDELVECFNSSETVSPARVEKLKGLIAKTRTAIKPELRLTETDFIAPEALEYISDDTEASLENMISGNSQPSTESQFFKQTSMNKKSDESQQTLVNREQKEPPLSDGELTYTTTRRHQRDADFAQRVKSVYNEKCAICGERRVTPDGNPEVEAAHIYPKSEGGVDHIRNGLALCKFHHWAFDNGWMALRENYRIIVADYQDQDGYEDLEQFDSKKILLPEKDEHKPHEKFISEHQKIHELEQ